MTSAEKKLAAIKAVAMIVAIPASIWLHAWAIQKLWGWFVASQFGLPTITQWQGLGLAMLVGYFTTDVSDILMKQELNKGKGGEIITMSIVRPLIAVGFAWLVKSYLL